MLLSDPDVRQKAGDRSGGARRQRRIRGLARACDSRRSGTNSRRAGTAAVLCPIPCPDSRGTRRLAGRVPTAREDRVARCSRMTAGSTGVQAASTVASSTASRAGPRARARCARRRTARAPVRPAPAAGSSARRHLAGDRLERLHRHRGDAEPEALVPGAERGGVEQDEEDEGRESRPVPRHSSPPDPRTRRSANRTPASYQRDAAGHRLAGRPFPLVACQRCCAWCVRATVTFLRGRQQQHVDTAPRKLHGRMIGRAGRVRSRREAAPLDLYTACATSCERVRRLLDRQVLTRMATAAVVRLPRRVDTMGIDRTDCPGVPSCASVWG